MSLHCRRTESADHRPIANPPRNTDRYLRGLALVLALGISAHSSVTLAGPSPRPVGEKLLNDEAYRCASARDARDAITVVDTTLAGVPAILRIPTHVARPPVVLWHGFGPPADRQALMAALPLDEVPAIKVYLGLPLFGARAPARGADDLAHRQARDSASLIFKPVVLGAAEELPAVVANLQQRGCMRAHERISLFGFSAGGASVLLALMQRKVAVSSAILLNASTGLNASIQAMERVTKKPYAWTPAARALARASDAVAHAADIARGDPPPAVLLVQGAADSTLTPQPATALYAALRPLYRQPRRRDRLRFVLVPGMQHSWIDSAAAAGLRRTFAAWLRRYA